MHNSTLNSGLLCLNVYVNTRSLLISMIHRVHVLPSAYSNIQFPLFSQQPPSPQVTPLLSPTPYILHPLVPRFSIGDILPQWLEPTHNPPNLNPSRSPPYLSACPNPQAPLFSSLVCQRTTYILQQPCWMDRVGWVSAARVSHPLPVSTSAASPPHRRRRRARIRPLAAARVRACRHVASGPHARGRRGRRFRQGRQVGTGLCRTANGSWGKGGSPG